MMRQRTPVIVAAAILACGQGGAGGVEVGADLSDTPGHEGAGFDATGDAAGPDAAVQTGAYARVIAGEEDLIGGPAARGVASDIVIGNRHSRFVVRTGKRGLFSPCAGVLLDADLARPAGEPGHDRFIEMFPMVGIGRVLCPESIEVADDGLASGTAVVRLRGTDAAFPIIESILPSMPLGLDVTMDYVLGPDSRHLDIVLRARNTKEHKLGVVVGQVLQLGDSIDFFAHGCGPDDACVVGRKDIDWLGGGSGDVSYGLTTPAGSRPSVLLSEDALLLVELGKADLPAGAEAEFRHAFIVGDGTLEDVVRQVRKVRGDEGETGTLVVVPTPAAAGTSPSDALLSVRLSGDAPRAWRTSSRAGADGKARIELPPGTYDIEVALPGAPTTWVEGVVVKAGEETAVPVTLAAPGRLEVTVVDGEGKPLDALLQLQAGHDAPATAAAALRPFFVRSGALDAFVEPGEYTAVASRGFAYDTWTGNVTVAAGAVARVDAVLHRVVATDGELFMDTHDHSELSIDTQIAAEDRLRNALAVGLDVYSTTDHDHIDSLQRWAVAAGLDDRILALPGAEVSPVFGHTASIGCNVTWEKDTYFEVPFLVYGEDGMLLRNATATEIWTSARNDFGCKLLIVAHPWDGSSGMLNTYEVTETSDPAVHLPAMDLRLVDAVEVVNSGQDWDEVEGKNLPRWFNILMRGYHVAAAGGSDQHEPSAALGHPRNLVPAGTSDPAAVQPESLYQAIKDFRSQVVGGPILRLSVNGKGSGEVAAVSGQSASLHLEVHAAPWVPVDTARVWVNGELVVDEAVAPGTGVVRAVIDRDIAVTRDAFVVAMAGSRTARLGIAASNRPSLSVTNPVFLDAGGDGYRAPLQPPR